MKNRQQEEKTWFTVTRMKNMAIAIITIDLILLLVWFCGAIYILVNLETHCYEVQFITHFLILIHFALGMYVATTEGEITKQQEEARMRGKILIKLPYYAYSPLTWIFTGLISFSGDLMLLVAAVRNYAIIGNADECQNSRAAHIGFDVIALIISIVTVLWFVIFSIYSVANRKRFVPYQEV